MLFLTLLFLSLSLTLCLSFSLSLAYCRPTSVLVLTAMKESTAVILELEKEGIDFIEISGGTYECAEMMKTAATGESTRKREAFFLEFAEKITQQTSVPLMVTGGFRTLAAMEQAVASGAVDIIGQARPYCAEPDLPKMFLAGKATKNLEYDLSFGPSFARSVRHRHHSS